MPSLSRTASTSSPARYPPVFIGHSPATRAVHGQLRSALTAGTSVLISGPSGSGKRVIAELICHHRCEGVAVHERRVDTHGEFGALAPLTYLCPIEQLGLGGQARLLDHAGELPLLLATRLEPGSDAWHARLHPDLLASCSQHVQLPPLTRRLDDLDVLAARILVETQVDRPIAGISSEALACLRQHSWPGNVSELEAVLERAFATARGFQVELWDLPAYLRLRDAIELDMANDELNPLSLAAAERDAILRALRQARGNKRLTARLLQVGKTTLYRKLARYGIG